jgi:hypothetical protein
MVIDFVADLHQPAGIYRICLMERTGRFREAVKALRAHASEEHTEFRECPVGRRDTACAQSAMGCCPCRRGNDEG